MNDGHYLRRAAAITLSADESFSSHRSRSFRHEDDVYYSVSQSVSITLTQSSSYQIAISIILGIIAISQVLMIVSFIKARDKRVLEFAMPSMICGFIALGTIITGMCYLYIYTSNIGCVLREPIIFISFSIMGAITAGRAWRMSSLLNNPLITGRNNNGEELPRVEKVRQSVLQGLSALSGCDFNALSVLGSRRTLRVKITLGQLLRVVGLLSCPQIIFQIVVMAVPSLRSSLLEEEVAYYEPISVGVSQCKSSVTGYWPIYVGILLSLIPFGCAYLLNIRPKSELNSLPEMIDELNQLKSSFLVFILVVVVSSPTVAMAITPEIESYGIICIILSLSLSLCYHIAYTKLESINGAFLQSGLKKESRGMRRGSRSSSTSSTTSRDSGSSAAYAVKMAGMYSNLGRVEESVELIDETLDLWRRGKGSSGSNIIQSVMNNVTGKDEEVAAGFTKNDLQSVNEDDLTSIINLLLIKGNAVHSMFKGGSGNQLIMRANINIDALKIFEACPSSNKMKDTSIIFPVYVWVRSLTRGGVIDQDDR